MCFASAAPPINRNYRYHLINGITFALCKVKVAHIYSKDQMAWAVYKYNERNGQASVGFEWLAKKPNKIKNQTIAEEYNKIDTRRDNWFNKQTFWADVLNHAIFSVYPSFDKDKCFSSIVIFNINGRKYFYLRNNRGYLDKFVFPSTFEDSEERLEEIVL